MSALSFSVVAARPDPYAAAPSIALELRIAESTGVQVHAIVLRTQVMLEPQRRRYGDGESEKLTDLFGTRQRYGDTLKSLVWANLSTTVGAFSGEATAPLALPCSYDFDVAANKYLHALEDGEIPLALFFTGTVFVEGERGMAGELVPWTCEARYRLPVTAFRETMEAHFPNSAWIRVHRDTFDELDRLRRASRNPTWDAALVALARHANAPADDPGATQSGAATRGGPTASGSAAMNGRIHPEASRGERP